MYILWTVLIGLVVGLIAQALMPGRDSEGFMLSTLLGIVGAYVGMSIGHMAGLYRTGESVGLVMSVAGALVVLFVFRKFNNRRSVGRF